jgi:hypothetical protein
MSKYLRLVASVLGLGGLALGVIALDLPCLPVASLPEDAPQGFRWRKRWRYADG